MHQWIINTQDFLVVLSRAPNRSGPGHRASRYVFVHGVPNKCAPIVSAPLPYLGLTLTINPQIDKHC